MAYLNHEEAFEDFKQRALEGISKHFPVVGREQTLVLKNLQVQADKADADDLEAQHKAKVSGDNFSRPVMATLALKDNQSGKERTVQTMKVGELPVMTRRYSYIVGGQEYQADNQWQLKPGVYTRRRQNGELETRFNVANRPAFDVVFDPDSKVFKMERGRSKSIPIYPLMKAMGVDDDTLEQQWGKDILDANKRSRGAGTALEKFYKADRKGAPASKEAAERYVRDALLGSELREDATETTLGKKFKRVEGDTMMRATAKMLKVQQGAPEDDRDSLVFKDLRSVGDYAYDKLTDWKMEKSIRNKMLRQINRADNPRDIVRAAMFNKPLLDTFKKNAAVRTADQVNPVEMMASSMSTTVMGPGGIQSEHAIVDETKYINPSHFGFLDPLHTPEGCFDAHTEVLTEDGWKLWPDVPKNAKFACLVDGRLEFNEASERQAFLYQGRMFGLRKPQVEYLVTANHRVLYKPLWGKKYRVERAAEVHGKRAKFTSTHKPLCATNYEYFMLPFAEGNNSSKNVLKVPFELWAELVGWYVSEGAHRYDEEESAYFVYLFQSEVNAKCCARIEWLLRQLPFTWQLQERENGRNKYSLHTKQLAYYFSQLGASCAEKRLPDGFLYWPEAARRRLLDALMWGDGRITNTHKRVKQNSFSYTTTSEILAKQVELLAVSLGYPETLKTYQDKREERYLGVHEVRLLRHVECSTQTSTRNKHDPYYSVDWNDMVYCATVPGSYLYVRRNGKRPIWSGNSKTGVTLHLPMGAKKFGKDVKIPVHNLQTGKREWIGPKQFMQSDVVLPDQVKWKDGKPTPVAPKVRVSSKANEFEDMPLSKAQYAMYHPSQSFSMTSNLIPFMGNTSGNRASYATAHIEQAISLEDRDVPLIQVSTGSKKEGARSFEEFVGRQTGHLSSVDGEVVKVDKRGVHIKGADGKASVVQMYNNFPLNDTKSVLNSTPIVRVGQKVKVGEPVADTNFTRGGTLALGKNLNVAYIPYKGYNFEDGVVISESAASALRSEHLHKPSVKLQEADVTAPRKFAIQHPESYKKAQYEKLGDDGVVRVGQKVNPGDPLVLAARPMQINDRSGIARIRKSLAGQHTDASMRWDSEHAGEVTAVHRNKKGELSVHVRTVEPMQVGDKLTGRYGNKGIVTKVVPDEEMPRTRKGEVVQVALNPSGVPGRMNVGQVLETALSKVAKKTGKPIILDNFEYGVDQVERAKAELKKHGLDDQEELIDPASGKSLGKALFGHQHMLKLRHQVDKKVSVRSGMTLRGETPETYDVNLTPTSGGKSGGQSLGNLGLNAMLAHGAKANIREMHTWKSEGPDPSPEAKKWPSAHHEVWNAIQLGEPLPAPKSTFAFQKFTDMLRASGVNVDKRGHRLQLSPMTDKEVLSLSSGELRKPNRLTYSKVDKEGNLKPIPGGLFDEKVTGGVGGKKWSHMKLPEPMPNPMFEGAIQKVLGLTSKQYKQVVEGEKALDKGGNLVALGKGDTGGVAVSNALKRVDVDKELALSRKELDEVKLPKNFAHGASTQRLDKALKKTKYLQLLQEKGVKPHEAYVLNHLPVLPPAMRQPSVMADGNVRWEDVNGLYHDFAQNTTTLKELKNKAHLGIGDPDLKEHRKAMYDGLRALVGVGQSAADRSDKNKGYMQLISGRTPKEGYFQKTLLSRRQDMTMRATIVPEPAMGLDDVALPGEKALKLFRPFVVKKMVEQGLAPNALEAQELLRDKNALKQKGVQIALDKAMEERPVLMKRDPVLHKHGIQAFKAHRTKSSAIKIHPLVVSGYNADFDGDAMGLFVPVSQEAVEEARGMMPTKNLFNEGTGRVTFTPTLESAFGLYRLSSVRGDGKKSFTSPAAALKAVQDGKHGIDELANIKGLGKTTPGRALLASALPDAMQQKMLSDHTTLLNGKGISALYGELARNHRDSFGDSANKLKDFGFDASYGHIRVKHPDKHQGMGAIQAAENPKDMQIVSIGTHSLSLADLTPDKKVRDSVIRATERRVGEIERSKLPKDQKNARVIDEWDKATKEMQRKHQLSEKGNPNNLYRMLDAGVKPSWGQYQQLKLAPMLVEDAAGNTIPTPVKRSYSEGLDMSGYWIQSSGARKGSIQKVQEVQDPGYFSKQLINTSMNLVVNGDDCGTQRGIGMPISSSDVHDRELVADLKVRGRTFGAGTVLSPDVVGQIRRLDKNAQAVVRSSLKCEHGEGLCQKCAGLAPGGKYYDKGTNMGVISAQSLGERSVQLALKAFHSGGVKATGGKGTLGAFDRTKQLTLLPKNIPDSAALSMRSGTVTKVESDKTGTNVFIEGEKHFVPRDSRGRSLTSAADGKPTAGWMPPKVGMRVEAGQQLSDPTRSFVNPHDLYRATNNMEKVQNFLTSELHDIYKPEGVRRQHVETVVKAMSNLTRVRNAGDASGILRGEYQQASKIRALNADLQRKGKRPVKHSPIMKGIDVMPLVMQEDWMAKMNYNSLTKTLTEAAAEGAVSDLHGLHPIPGAAYGAEFGMTSKHTHKKPHLADVPTWSY